MPHRSLITTTEALAEFCATLAQAEFITLDTEFIREKTYFPQLCLLQIAGPEDARAIDPLAPGLDLGVLRGVLTNPNVVKVFHAGRQDLEIFFHLFGAIPAPVFDTQIAAQAAGFGEAVSYSEFIQKTTGARIDKASRLTDWARRPLSERQLLYALSDVTHLREAYGALLARLQKGGRLSWVEEEMQALYDTSQYVTLPEQAWKRLKVGNMKPKQLAVLRAVAAWREGYAQKQDIPRGRIIRDETLLEIASTMPLTKDELSHIRGMERCGRHVCDALLAAVAEAVESPQDTWPKPTARNGTPAHVGELADIFQLLLKLRCSQEQVLPRMVAGRDELELLASGERGVRCMQGWRHTLFGVYAEALLCGKLHIAYDPQTRQIVLRE